MAQQTEIGGVKFWEPHLSNISPDAQIGAGTVVHSHVWIGDGVIIGQNCSIGAFAFLPPGVILEDYVFIGPHVCFTNDKSPPLPRELWLKTLVKGCASIGAATTILPGLIIGAGARIGAGSVVTKDVPDGETWYGQAARKS